MLPKMLLAMVPILTPQHISSSSIYAVVGSLSEFAALSKLTMASDEHFLLDIIFLD
jgi:hypothetical protein